MALFLLIRHRGLATTVHWARSKIHWLKTTQRGSKRSLGTWIIWWSYCLELPTSDNVIIQRKSNHWTKLCKAWLEFLLPEAGVLRSLASPKWRKRNSSLATACSSKTGCLCGMTTDFCQAWEASVRDGLTHVFYTLVKTALLCTTAENMQLGGGWDPDFPLWFPPHLICLLGHRGS